MNNTKGKAIIFTFIALGVALIYWAIVTQPAPQSKDVQPTTENKSMSYSGNTITEAKNGVKIWEMTAEFIEVDATTQNVTLKNMNGKFYQPNGIVVTLTAPQAQYEAKAKNITIDGGVHATTTDDSDLKAQKMFWDAEAQTLTGEQNIILRHGDTVIVGDKIETQDGFQKVKVSGNAHITKGEAQ
jgi:LPS export ABC transporter protein LptC